MNKINSEIISNVYSDLKQLGIRSGISGTTLINKAIQLAILNDDEYFNISDIYKKLALSSNGKFTQKQVRELIRYAIENRDNSKTKENFEKIFGYEYNQDIFTNKEFIIELLRLYLNKNHF